MSELSRRRVGLEIENVTAHSKSSKDKAKPSKKEADEVEFPRDRGRVYKSGSHSGKKHLSTPRKSGSRKGYNDCVDISSLGGEHTHANLVGQQLLVKCTGRRTYVAIAVGPLVEVDASEPDAE